MEAKKSISNILILTRTVSTGLSMIRLLGASGYTIDVIASTYKEDKTELIAASSYVRNFEEIVGKKTEGESGENRILEAIRSYYNEYDGMAVLLPSDDYTSSIVDKNREEISEHFLIPYVKDAKPGEIVRLMDKFEQAQLAKQHGVVAPKATIINTAGFEAEALEGLPYPVFVKPVRSISGYKTEMAICENADELRAQLEKLAEKYDKYDLLVQEYIDYEQQYTIAGVCLDQTILAPAAILKTREATHERGLMIEGELIDISALGQENVDRIWEMLRSVHYVGCFDVELFKKGETIYFNEINFRTSGASQPYSRFGFNIPACYVEYLINGEITYNEGSFSGFGCKLVYDQVAWDECMHDGMSKEELDALLANREQCILIGDESDPEPSRLFLEENETRYARRLKLQQRKERCIEHAMETAGWDRALAEKKIADAKARLDISYNDYRRNNFCLLSDEEQEVRYKELLKERAAKKWDSPDGKPLVVVLSRIYPTGLAVVRSLGSMGYTVDLIANCRKEGGSEIISKSRYIRNSVEIVSRKVAGGGDWAIINALLEYRNVSEGQKIVLFPTDDYTTAVVDSNRDKLEDIFVMPYIVGAGEGAITERMSKIYQSEVAREVGLKLPDEWVISLEDEIDIPGDVSYPVFCKPIESITGFKVEMAKCESDDELLKHLTWLKDRNSNRCVLVQEYLEIENEIDLSGVCLDQKIIIPAIIKKTQVAQFEKGVTLAGKLVPAEELGELLDKIVELMKKFHYVGMFDLEFNIVNGEYYFNEVNFRSGGPNFSYFMSGVNLPNLVVKEWCGQGHSEEEEKVAEYGKQFIYEKVAWDDYAHCFINKRQLNKMLESADIRLMEYKDDPAPTELFLKNIEELAEKTHKYVAQENIKKVLRPYLGSINQKLRGFPQSKRANKRNPNAETPRVLVSGRNYCSNLCMAKSLSLAGYEVEVLRIFQRKPGQYNILRTLKPEMKSAHVKAYYECNSKRNKVRIVERLKRIADENNKMLIIPADDLVADIIDEAYDELKDYYIMPNVDNMAGGISKLMNKDVQKQLAKDAGLPVLNSCVIKSTDFVDGEIEIPESVNFPCFIKPNVSKNSSKSKMMMCETKEILVETLKERAALGFEYLVEDYVHIKRELSYLGVSTTEGAISPGYFEAVVGGEGKHRGVALLGRMLDCETAEPLISQVNKFVESLNYNGLFDVDLIETTEGKIYFVELNLRYGASGYAFTKCGVNLPGMFADYMLKGKPIDKACRLETAGKTFTSEKVLYDEYIEGLITLEELDKYMEMAELHFVLDDIDMKPYKHLYKHRKRAGELREYNFEQARQAEEAARAREVANTTELVKPSSSDKAQDEKEETE